MTDPTPAPELSPGEQAEVDRFGIHTPLDNAEPGSIWRITGNYRGNNGDMFHDCLAIVIEPAIHGTDETVLSMLPPLGWGPMQDRIIAPDQVTWSRLVITDPWADR